MIVRAFLKGLLKVAHIVVVICLALYPIVGVIAEGIAQIVHGYNGIGYAQFAFLGIAVCLFSAAAIYHIAVFLGKQTRKDPSVVGQVISAKASKICLKVGIK